MQYDTTGYQTLSEWNWALEAQDNGAAIWILFVSVIVLFVWFRFRRKAPDSNVRMVIRLSVLVILYLSLIPGIVSNFPIYLGVGLLAFVAVPYTRFTRARLQLPTLAWIIILALVVRLPGMFEPRWYDEIITTAMASIPLQDMLTAIAGDVHPPLYYGLVRLVVLVAGGSAFAVRLPSLVFALASIWLMYQIGSRWNHATGITAALLLALLPAHIYYSVEARPYAMMLFVVLLMLWSVQTDRCWLFVVAGSATALSHNIGYVYLVVVGSYVVWMYRWRWLAPVMAAFTVAALWMPTLMKQRSHLDVDGWWLRPFTPSQILAPLTDMLVGTRIPSWYILQFVAVMAGVLVLALIVSRSKLWQEPEMLLVMFGVPVLIIGHSVIRYNIYLERPLIASVTLLLVPVAYLIQSAYHADRRTLAFVLIPLSVLGVIGFYQEPRENTDLQTACSGADVIFNTSVENQFISSVTTDFRTVLWSGATVYRNQSIREEYLYLFDFEKLSLDDLAGQRVCVIDAQYPHSNPKERAYFRQNLIPLAEETTVIWSHADSAYMHAIQFQVQ